MQTGVIDPTRNVVRSSAAQFILPLVGVGILAAVVFASDPYGSWWIIVTLVAMLAAAVAGAKLPAWARVAITGVFLIQGFWWCLYTRTMDQGLTIRAVVGMLAAFGMFGLLPLLTAFCLWPRKAAVTIVVAGILLCVGTAAAVAGIEEAIFVAKHKERGAGLTPRWLMPGHVLWYDGRAQRLYGGD